MLTIDFDSGEEKLNSYLTNYALENDIINIGKTFVCLENDEIVGFVTIANAQVDFQEMPDDYKKEMPRYPVPAIRIARLAVDKRYQKQGYGKRILSFAFKKILLASYNTGIKVIIVDAKEHSKSFYEHFGFLKLVDSTYFLPIETIISALIH